MQFEISPIQLVTICAVINGFVFAFLLFEKKENRRANRFLSLMIFSMCLTFTPYMLDPSIWNKFRWLAWMPFSLSYWIGPAFYFYVRTLTHPSRPLTKKWLWHFSPIVLNYLHSTYHAYVKDSNPWPWFHHFAEILEYVAILSILTYMIVSYRAIAKYQKSLLDSVSNTDQIDLLWIRRLILIIIASFGVILILLVISRGHFGMDTFHQWDFYRSIVLLIYAAILYWVSISGFQQAQTLNLAIEENPQGAKDGNELSIVVTRLQECIADGFLYRNPELSLTDLSKFSGISQRAISDAIHQELGKNYYQFINEYRVEEMKMKLLDNSLNHFKIFSLAIDSGFNSKASFNRVFKTYTGHTPKEFKSQNS
ncbi:MAG: AraC family transcriptional regulator, partial [Cyclobacteriaceae bacterium]